MCCYITDFTSRVHDNIVQSYFVDIKNGVLEMNTCTESKECTNIEFTGLLAHLFENVLTTNIILGLYQISIQSYIDDEREKLLESLKFGFPSLNARSCDELKEELGNGHYKVFRLDSSIGMSGYIIARDIKII